MKISEATFRELFIAMLDVHEENVITILGITLERSEVLEKCDPIAFRQAMLNQADSLGYELE